MMAGSGLVVFWIEQSVVGRVNQRLKDRNGGSLILEDVHQ